jgi:hypothetical protein
MQKSVTPVIWRLLSLKIWQPLDQYVLVDILKGLVYEEVWMKTYCC